MKTKRNQRIYGPLKVALTMVCLLLGIPVASGILIERPENTVALLDQVTNIKCKSDHNRKLLWHTSGNSSELEELWSGYFMNPRACPASCCQIDNHEPGKYNLNVTARMETAKRYICTEPGTLMRASAELIVIESEPNCTHNEISLSCSIVVYGKWLPQFKWITNDGKQMNDSVISVKSGKVVSTFTLPPRSVEVYYTASVYFSVADRPTEVSAKNVPAYKWTSTSFKAAALHYENSPPNIITQGAIIAFGVGLGGVIILSATGIFLLVKSRTGKKNLNNKKECESCVAKILVENPSEKKPDEESCQGEKENCVKIDCRMQEAKPLKEKEPDPATNVIT